MPLSKSEVLHASSDQLNAYEEFGGTVPVSLKEGICMVAVWAREAGARQCQEFGNVEITEKLPEGWQIKKVKKEVSKITT